MMKTFTIGAVAIALSLPALAQDVTSLPQCAQTPILNAIADTGCGGTDVACICGNAKFIAGLVEAIPKVCSPSDVDTTKTLATALCNAYGIQLDLSSSVAGGAASSTAVPSSSAEVSSSTEVTSSSAEVPSSSAEVPSSSAQVSSSSAGPTATTTSATPVSTESSATSEAPAQQTTNAAMENTVGMFSLVGAMAAGLLAVL